MGRRVSELSMSLSAISIIGTRTSSRPAEVTQLGLKPWLCCDLLQMCQSILRIRPNQEREINTLMQDKRIFYGLEHREMAK